MNLIERSLILYKHLLADSVVLFRKGFDSIWQSSLYGIFLPSLYDKIDIKGIEKASRLYQIIIIKTKSGWKYSPVYGGLFNGLFFPA